MHSIKFIDEIIIPHLEDISLEPKLRQRVQIVGLGFRACDVLYISTNNKVKSEGRLNQSHHWYQD
jgi:hypothetical protein